MNADLYDDIWRQSGTSLLWDPNALNSLCIPSDIRSLREFLQLRSSGWPDDGLRLIKNRTLIVAGLEAVIDSLAPEEAIEWLEQNIYTAVRDFQDNVADGGREAALILWLANGKRVFNKASDNTYHWHCTGEHNGHSIPLGRCLWNGAQGSARRIIGGTAEAKGPWLGLFHPRIS